MLFILGYIVGLVTAALIVATLAYFRKVIESKSSVIEKKLGNMGPRPRGFIVEPSSLADEARERIVERNKAEGKNTKLEELQ